MPKPQHIALSPRWAVNGNAQNKNEQVPKS